MAATHVHNGTSALPIAAAHVNDGVSTYAVKEIWVNNGGGTYLAWSAYTLLEPTPTPGATIETEGNTNGGTFYAYITPGTDGYTGTVGNVYGPNLAFGSSTGAGVATGKYFKYTGSASYTNMTAGLWYPVGAGYYCGAKRTNSDGTTTNTLTISFANDAAGNGATTGASWIFKVVIAPF